MKQSQTKLDETGLLYIGRNPSDGRYLYRSISVLRASNVVRLTHEQRVELAMWQNALRAHFPGHTVYPMTRQGRHWGFGTFGGKTIWINRLLLTPEQRAGKCAETIAHELGHNLQPGGSKPHGPEFRMAMARAMVKLRAGTKNLTVWPMPNRTKMRDSVAPLQRKKVAASKRAAGKRETTRCEKWSAELANAAKRLGEWERKQKQVERKVSAWAKRKAKAARLLARAQADEKVS